VTTKDERRGALAAVDRLVNRGGEADEVLRGAIAALAHLYAYAGIRLVESDRLVDGPSLGTRPEEPERFPISFRGVNVGELEVSGPDEEDRALLERVALLISAYCLAWEP
jgi:hypothetical protein